MKGRKESGLFLCVCIALTMTFGGCGGKREAVADDLSVPTEETQTFHFLEAEGEDKADNRVDDLRAVINLPIRTKADESQTPINCGGHFVLGENGGGRFFFYYQEEGGRSKHLWTEISGITADGEEYYVKLPNPWQGDPDRLFTDMSATSGGDGYVAKQEMRKEEADDGDEAAKIGERWLYRLDKNFQIQSCVQARIDSEHPMSEFIEDGNGYFHVLTSHVDYSDPVSAALGEWDYYVLSPDGETVFESSLENQGRLYAYGEGEVCVSDQQPADTVDRPKGRRFYRYDPERNDLVELAVSKEETVQKRMSSIILDATPISENRIAWCTHTGIFVYDREIGKSENVYKWSNHGINVVTLGWRCFHVTKDGRFELIYYDGKEYNYLQLEPTGEKEELSTITLAVTPENKSVYDTVATLFQKHYPSCAVEVRDDYDQTSLLTWLGAGKGPVLVDTGLTGLDSLEKLWQSMDGFLEQTGLEGEIYPEVLELGKIGDVTYGLARDFRIETLLVPAAGPSDWDYDGFLDALEGFSGAAFTYGYLETEGDMRDRFFETLKNGYNDTYFWDGDGTTVFGTAKFDRVLRLSEKAASCPPAEGGRMLKERKALCEHYDLLFPWDVLRLRGRLEKNGEKAVGYPTGSGARHLLVAPSVIAMRSTATDEEKKIAYTFLRFMLSEEAYEAVPSNMFPVRRDQFEHMLDLFEMTEKSLKENGTYDPEVYPEIHREEDAAFFEELMKNSVAKVPFPAGLEAIFDEEFGEYLSGFIDDRTLSEHLKSRVWLYQEEQK